jgi:hypothetical protein
VLPAHGLTVARAAQGRGLSRVTLFELEGWLWALVKVDPAMLDETFERVNISLPRRVLHRLDSLARNAGETRSGFIARMAIEGREPAAQS